MALLQLLLVFAAPVSACCRTGSAQRSAHSAEAAVDCCPAGAHAPGECPLHKTRRGADCVMRCDNVHAPGFVLGINGVLSRPTFAPIDLAIVSAGHEVAAATLVSRSILPVAPPPKAL